MRGPRPSWVRTPSPSSRPRARAVVSTASRAKTTPLAGRRRPCTWTTDAATAATASAISVEIVKSVESLMGAILPTRRELRITRMGRSARKSGAALREPQRAWAAVVFDAEAGAWEGSSSCGAATAASAATTCSPPSSRTGN